jgi:hypothetical protein
MLPPKAHSIIHLAQLLFSAGLLTELLDEAEKSQYNGSGYGSASRVMSLTDEEFVKNFCMNKTLFLELVRLVDPHLQHNNGAGSLRPHQ